MSRLDEFTADLTGGINQLIAERDSLKSDVAIRDEQITKLMVLLKPWPKPIPDEYYDSDLLLEFVQWNQINEIYNRACEITGRWTT